MRYKKKRYWNENSLYIWTVIDERLSKRYIENVLLYLTKSDQQSTCVNEDVDISVEFDFNNL
jgi:hypothetical protein